MKVIKPLRLSVLHRVMEHEGQCSLVVTVLAYFSFDRPARLLPEVSMWTEVGMVAPDSILDECTPKPRREVLVDGLVHARTPKGKTAMSVELTLGDLKKQVYVVGDRHWDGRKPSDPKPFVSMPLTWERAFGGPQFAANPLGRGAELTEVTGPEGTKSKVRLLPNIEDPKHAVASPKDQPTPVSFSRRDLAWPQRQKYRGTYDQAWIDHRAPDLPVDFDAHLYQLASEDQWFDTLAGGEAFSITNMHAEKAEVSGVVPTHNVRCFVNKRVVEPSAEEAQSSEAEVLEEVRMAPCTLRLFPNEERGVLVYRGICRVAEDDAEDVLQLVIAADAVDAPRPISHYRSVLAQRLDKEKGGFFALQDRDLLHADALAGENIGGEAFVAEEKFIFTEQLHLKNARRGAVAEHAALVERLKEQGIDPTAHGIEETLTLPPIQEQPGMDTDYAKLFEELQDEVDDARTKAEATQASEEIRVRKEAAEAGKDYDALVALNEGTGTGPPKFRADDEYQKVCAQHQLALNAGTPLEHVTEQLEDPAFLPRLKKVEELSHQSYRLTAHHQDAAPSLDDETSSQRRRALETILAAATSTRGLDLTGADLRGLPLAGADLSGAFMESTNLEGADLRGANLSEAVLTRANLRHAKLDGCNLAGANLGGCDMASASMVDAKMPAVILAKADLSGTNLSGTDLVGVDFMDAVVVGTNFEKARLLQPVFFRLDFRNVNFAGASIEKASFVECRLADITFDEANIVEMTFVQCVAKQVSFRLCTGRSLRLVMDSVFAGASFRGATMMQCNFRDTDLRGAEFCYSSFGNSDFSKADLRDSDLRGMSAHRSLFLRTDVRGADLSETNLRETLFQKAHIEGASFQKANLFRADLSKIHGNVGTKFDGANLNQIRFVKRSS